MGFMSRYAGTERVDVTDLGPDDDVEYWVEIRRLSGDEWDRADAVHVRTSANLKMNSGKAKAARQAAARRRAAMANGQDVEDDEDLTALLSFDAPAYRRAVLGYGIVGWNLTDLAGRIMPLKDDAGRAAAIAGLPPEVRDRLFERIEALRPKKRGADEDADFRDALPVGGEEGHLGSSADSGDLDAGDLVVASWADAGGGSGDV